MEYSQLRIDHVHSLEHYSRIRDDFRKSVLAHQKKRRVQLSEDLVLCFEDHLTVQYQVQEILRAARIFERELVKAELDAYTPLIPTGGEAKATLMLQSPEAVSHPEIGECVWLQLAGARKITASSDYKSSGCAAMQWLAFEFDDDSIARIEELVGRGKFSFTMGVDDKRFQCQHILSREVCELIVRDVLAVV